MKKKKKNKSQIITNLSPGIPNSECYNIIASEEDNSVYIQISGFEDFDHVIDYAEYLSKYLPLLLHHTQVLQ